MHGYSGLALGIIGLIKKQAFAALPFVNDQVDKIIASFFSLLQSQLVNNCKAF